MLPQEAQSVPWVFHPRLAMPSGTGPGQCSRSGCWLHPAQPVFCSLHRLIFSLLAFECVLLHFKTPPKVATLLNTRVRTCSDFYIKILGVEKKNKRLQLFGEFLEAEGHWIKARGDLKAGRASVPTQRFCDSPVSMGHWLQGLGCLKWWWFLFPNLVLINTLRSNTVDCLLLETDQIY